MKSCISEKVNFLFSTVMNSEMITQKDKIVIFLQERLRFLRELIERKK